MFTVFSSRALFLPEQQLVSVSVPLSEGGVYKRLTYGMNHRERDHRVRLFKPIPAFLSSLLSAAIGHLDCYFLFFPCKRVTINHLLFSSCLCCFHLLLCPFSLASMGTEVNHAQQDFWLCQCFLSVLLCTYN